MTEQLDKFIELKFLSRQTVCERSVPFSKFLGITNFHVFNRFKNSETVKNTARRN